MSTDANGTDLLRAALLTDHGSAGPYESYRRLRTSHPVLQTSSGVVVLSRHRDCDSALRDRKLGKADESLGFGLTEVPVELQREAMHRFRRTMLFRNPPDHTRLRRLITDVFTTRHVEFLRTRIVATIEHLLDEMADKPTVDVMTDLALPLPVTVIGDLLGLPAEGRELAAHFVRDLVAPLEPMSDAQAVRRAARAEDYLAAYLGTLLAAKRIHPADDLLSRLAAAHGEDRLDDDECVGTAILLFAAGFETTTNLIGNGLAALLANPCQADLLRRQPALSANAIEELLRYDAPIQTNGRTVLEPTQIAGVDLEPGQVVVTLLGAANRDPDHVTRPDALDITRIVSRPLSFGAGIHFCLGAALARMEGAELFPRLLDRFPELAATGEAKWRPGLSFRGLISLPVATQ
ncbi:cytochrome P450 [Williamsia limnetica]|uniref:Cytochrome P450 n=1 Tax=Williamsia limnetica TaxID=882452 RepID=A0A318RBX3_WILLI|nr:cytochrome P450 [Williamsia limnetica]PYE13513.1 cytochrome P450 [Williamsia limnetica]